MAAHASRFVPIVIIVRVPVSKTLWGVKVYTDNAQAAGSRHCLRDSLAQAMPINQLLVRYLQTPGILRAQALIYQSFVICMRH